MIRATDRTAPFGTLRRHASMARVSLVAAQGNLVRLGDVVSLDGSQSFAETHASLPEKVERVGERVPRGGALRISPMLFDEVGLKGCSDFVGRLERLVDGPLPSVVVNHTASMPRRWLRPQPIT